MSPRFPLGSAIPNVNWSDERLVKACRTGNEKAWEALIGKYKNLIYSIPIKYRATPDDAADIFQAVCLELYSQLPRLRKVESLRSWLITVTAHKCFHWKKRRVARWEKEVGDVAEMELPGKSPVPLEIMEELEQEQRLREALNRLPDRCRELIHMLFYEEPPRPYQQVAEQLGLAIGSIGFIRGRCLKRLQKFLEESDV